MVACPAQSTGIHVHGIPTVHKDVIFDPIISTTPDKCGTSYIIENIAGYLGTTEHIIEIHPNSTVIHESINVVKVVVSDHRTTHRPVPACINGSCIIGF